MRGPEFRSGDLVIERVGEPGLAAEIGNAIVAQDAAVRISAEVAFKRGAGGEIQRLLPAKTGQERQAAGEALFQAEHQSVVIGHAVCAGERKLRELLQGTAGVGVGDGPARTVNRRVAIRSMEQKTSR